LTKGIKVRKEKIKGAVEQCWVEGKIIRFLLKLKMKLKKESKVEKVKYHRLLTSKFSLKQ